VDVIALYLHPHDYICKNDLGAHEALSSIEHEAFDIVLMDIMMPEMHAWEFCKEIRRLSDVSIIMLIARDTQEDIIQELQLGAVNYITQPFHEDELLARMEALMRRNTPRSLVEINGLLWNKEQFELTFKSQFIKLTPKEFIMIGHFMK